MLQNSFFLSNYLLFDKQFITYIVILCNHNSFTEIKKLTLELAFKKLLHTESELSRSRLSL